MHRRNVAARDNNAYLPRELQQVNFQEDDKSPNSICKAAHRLLPDILDDVAASAEGLVRGTTGDTSMDL